MNSIHRRKNDGNSAMMQSLIDRHFKSPELRQLAQRVILADTKTQQTKRPRRRIISHKPKPNKHEATQTIKLQQQQTRRVSKFPKIKTPNEEEMLPVTVVGLSTAQQPAISATEEEEDWGSFNIETSTPSTRKSTAQDGPIQESGQRVSEGPILLPFRGTGLETETKVGNMVFDAVNQKWISTEQEDEDDIMAGFSDSEDEEIIEHEIPEKKATTTRQINNVLENDKPATRTNREHVLQAVNLNDATISDFFQQEQAHNLNQTGETNLPYECLNNNWLYQMLNERIIYESNH